MVCVAPPYEKLGKQCCSVICLRSNVIIINYMYVDHTHYFHCHVCKLCIYQYLRHPPQALRPGMGGWDFFLQNSCALEPKGSERSYTETYDIDRNENQPSKDPQRIIFMGAWSHG